MTVSTGMGFWFGKGSRIVLLEHGILFGMLLVILGCIYFFWKRWKRGQPSPWVGLLQQQATLMDREALLMERLTRLETRVDVFWFKAGRDAAVALHSPDSKGPERKDTLIERFIEGQLTPGEMQEFEEFLLAITLDRQAIEGHRLAAAIVLRALEAYGTTRS